MKRRIFMVVAAALCLSTFLTACADPVAQTGVPEIDAMDIQTMANQLLSMVDQRNQARDEAAMLQLRIEELELKVLGIQYADPEFPAIIQLEDETGRAAFSKPGSYIALPEGLAYPGVDSIAAVNKVAAGGDRGFTINMSPAWSFRSEGNRLNCSSTTSVGIYGEIVVGQVRELDMDMLNIIFEGHEGQEEIVDDWGRVQQPFIPRTIGVINAIPPNNEAGGGRDGAIMWGGRQIGRQVALNTLVEGRPAVIRVGALVADQVNILYVFIYETARDEGCEEIILRLLSSLAVNNREISIEF